MNEQENKNQKQHEEGKRISSELRGILYFLIISAVALAVVYYFVKM